ncbi:MAG: NAD(P)-binding domain-containing protein [Ruthenibacterium lactatiformans]
MNKERNICIVGLGLPGGSYAMGLTDAGYTVTAVDVRPEAIRYALEKGIMPRARWRTLRRCWQGPMRWCWACILTRWWIGFETTRSTSSPARCLRMCAA